MLLGWEPQLWHQRDLNGMLPLHWCCSRGYTGVTNQLLLALHSESKFLTVSKLQKKTLIFCNFNYDKKKSIFASTTYSNNGKKNHFCTKRKVFKNNVIFGHFFPCFRSQCLESSKNFFFCTWWWWSGSQMRSPKTGDWFNRWLWQNTSLIGSIKWQSSVFSGEENHFRPRDHIWRVHIFLLLYYFKLHNSLI